MVRPDDALAPGETVQKHLHRHRKVMIRPALWTMVAFGVFLVGVLILPTAVAAYVVLALLFLAMFLPLGLWPFLVWRNTRFVFTNERVLLLEGVIRRERRDILLAQVNDVKYAQTLLDRFFGSGTLTVQFSDKKDPSVLKSIPNILAVHEHVVHQLVEAGKKQQSRDDTIRDGLADLLRQSGAAAAPKRDTSTPPPATAV